MIFKGTATALITPFKNGKFDKIGYKKLLSLQISGGVNALVSLGTTGEPATLSKGEKEMILSMTIDEACGKIPVIAGVGSNCTETALENAKRAEKLGANALLVVTPYYNKCTQDGLFAHYKAISNETSLPIICYNVPSRTGVNILPETFQKIAELKNIDGIKEASGNMAQIMETIRLAGGKASVYSGDDALTLPILASGGKGVISVASNVLPRQIANLTAAFFAGDLPLARKLQLDTLPLINALFCETNPIPIKYAASLLGIGDGSVRLPLTPAGEQCKRLIDNLLKAQ